MKATTLQKRIESELTLKDGKTIAKKYADVLDMLIFNKTYRPYYYSGTGRFTSCAGVDYISTALKMLGVDFETGNDAPRGGHSGYFVRLTKKGIEQTKEWRSERLFELKKQNEMLEKAAAEAKQIHDEKIQQIKDKIKADPQLSNFISRKRFEGEKDRTIAWKLTSETRVPNLYGYSVKEILNAIL